MSAPPPRQLGIVWCGVSRPRISPYPKARGTAHPRVDTSDDLITRAAVVVHRRSVRDCAAATDQRTTGPDSVDLRLPAHDVTKMCQETKPGPATTRVPTPQFPYRVDSHGLLELTDHGIHGIPHGDPELDAQISRRLSSSRRRGTAFVKGEVWPNTEALDSSHVDA